MRGHCSWEGGKGSEVHRKIFIKCTFYEATGNAGLATSLSRWGDTEAPHQVHGRTISRNSHCVLSGISLQLNTKHLYTEARIIIQAGCTDIPLCFLNRWLGFIPKEDHSFFLNVDIFVCVQGLNNPHSLHTGSSWSEQWNTPENSACSNLIQPPALNIDCKQGGK